MKDISVFIIISGIFIFGLVITLSIPNSNIKDSEEYNKFQNNKNISTYIFATCTSLVLLVGIVYFSIKYSNTKTNDQLMEQSNIFERIKMEKDLNKEYSNLNTPEKIEETSLPKRGDNFPGFPELTA